MLYYLRDGRGKEQIPPHPSFHDRKNGTLAFYKIHRNKEKNMKAKVILLLHLFGLDVLLLGLIEKLLLGLSKRVAVWKDAATISLNRCKHRNGTPPTIA